MHNIITSSQTRMLDRQFRDGNNKASSMAGFHPEILIWGTWKGAMVTPGICVLCA